MTPQDAPGNPYPGLRPFEPNEAELFFGREHETDELRRRLRATRLLAVVGSSGTGKSSLVRCGLIPSLHGGFMARAGTGWRVAIARPGEDPIGRLADALDRPDVLGRDRGAENAAGIPLDVTLRDSSLGLAEAVRHAQLPAGVNVLVVIDQFEELFRFHRSRSARAGADDATTFVRLLIEASRREDLPIFVVITMRSEFIGECVAFDGLPEAINEGQYLIPRMSRDALRAVIAGPAAVRHAAIAPRLLVRLLNEVADDLDRLPVLQHALMRTWDAWARDHGGDDPIDIRHYEATGTMREALSRHAEEAYGELTTESERRVSERLFKTLTETTEEGHGVRRPTPAQRLAEVCETDLHGLERVVDRFRATGRAFLQPPAGAPLSSDAVVDISHESLMRVWRRLAGWVTEEARAVDIYRRLARSAAEHAAGEAGLWRPPELTLGLRWLRQTRPKAAWAGDPVTFERAMRFLSRSRRAHHVRIGLATAAVVAAVALAVGWFQAKAARERTEIERLRGELTALRAANIKEQRAGQVQSERVQGLRQHQAGLKTDVDALQQTHAALEESVAGLREENHRLDLELTQIRAETTRLESQSDLLAEESRRLTSEKEDLAERTTEWERVGPVLDSQVAAVRSQVAALSERRRVLNGQLRETLPCPRASMRPPSPPPPPASGSETSASVGAAPPPPPMAIPAEPTSSDALRKEIAALTRELERLRGEKASLEDEAGWLERENALLERQRELLRQDNGRLEQEQQALTTRRQALQASRADAEDERKTLAARVAVAAQHNREAEREVAAARAKHRALENTAVANATTIGQLRDQAERLRADIERIAGILAGHVDRLLGAARGAGQATDVAALLALQAWRWAPYDPDDPAHPGVYNTLWEVLNRLDTATARRLVAPDTAEHGRLATTRSDVIAAALCARVSRPLTEAEWRRFMPEQACFNPSAARPCER